MEEKIITDNSEEIIMLKWDGERFALCSMRTEAGIKRTVAIIVLNPIEMMKVVQFASKLGEVTND